ncbi:MAG: hypothetical protein GKR88_15315 [Flavobacteriaceae bacterium]|nr:MAG: hypothetical protein GKR88_15315 [Flavobacteriaceae bacterium]
MKRVLVILLICVFISCSNNDTNIDAATPNLSKKLMEEKQIVSLSNGGAGETVRKFHYSSNTLIMITATHNNLNSNSIDTTRFEYLNDKISKIKTVSWQQGIPIPSESILTYQNDLIKSISIPSLLNTINYEYNTDNLISGETDSFGNTSTYTYDSNSNRISVTNNNNTTTINFDSKNNPYKNVYQDYFKKVLYIGSNNSISNSDGTVWTYEYDTDDFPSKVTFNTNGNDWEIEYRYE